MADHQPQNLMKRMVNDRASLKIDWIVGINRSLTKVW